MIFKDCDFVKPNIEFKKEYTGKNCAPIFRKVFNVNKFKNAIISVCGLGIAYYWINGKPISDNLFTAPVSDYNKLLWYNRYDVTDLLQEGENTICVICGNGWYNEEIRTTWFFEQASWRDLPKFILKLETDGNSILKSDGSWKCGIDGPVIYNNLRNGEYFDFNLADNKIFNADYDDSLWDNAAVDDTPPNGRFAECLCEPIREVAVHSTKTVKKLCDSKYVFDIGQNISGYIRITTECEKGRMLVFKYAEDVDENGEIYINEGDRYTLDGEFMTDKIICSGEKITWSPKFAYHGFRYIEITGIKSPEEVEVFGVEVHNDIKRRTEFKCSNESLNKLFEAGIASSYSNMFYSLTDCPTREKLGWENDAQSSIEQMLTNFEIEKMLVKWLEDIKESMKENGEMPCIVPTYGWGFDFGTGPVSNGVLFEIPYRIFLHTGNEEPLIGCIDYFERYIKFLQTKKNECGLIEYGLDDWANPTYNHIIPTGYINAFYEYKFYKICNLAKNLAGENDNEYGIKAQHQKEFIIKSFISPSGQCVYNKQTAVALLIYYGIYENIEPLKKQLMNLVEETDFHLDCGMVGMRLLFHALNKCDLQEYSYRILCVKGNPGYMEWLELGATTLWEYWQHGKNNGESKNHHMYSDFMSWMIKTICGISIDEKKPGKLIFNVNPYFFSELNSAECTYETICGLINVEWHREKNEIILNVTTEEKMNVFCNGCKLKTGINTFKFKS